ncbi:hypothetical protein AB1Y20_012066 [Prymnesium parvum]|uniref:Dolichol kinase n=1 Tax=Prymnesium parvum TaxID=97485 RepID=A0AB34IR24_PRYPA
MAGGLLLAALLAIPSLPLSKPQLSRPTATPPTPRTEPSPPPPRFSSPRPLPIASRAVPPLLEFDQPSMLVLLTTLAAALTCASAALLSLAFTPSLPLPTRSLLASSASLAIAAALERLAPSRRAAAVLSEVSQALAIVSAGWLAFSSAWAAGVGSVASPHRRTPLEIAMLSGVALAAAACAALRPPSAAHTLVPAAALLCVIHAHPYLSARRALSGALLPIWAAVVGLCVATPSIAFLSLHRAGAYSSMLGAASVAALATSISLGWVFLSLLLWTFSNCPSWGLAAIGLLLPALELNLRHLLRLQVATLRDHATHHTLPFLGFFGGASYACCNLARWLTLIASWRACWFDESHPSENRNWYGAAAEVHAGRLERHFYSLLCAFGLTGLSSAALGRQAEAAACAGMAMLTIARVIISSLFWTEPLLLAGVLGLILGGGSLALVLRLSD